MQDLSDLQVEKYDTSLFPPNFWLPGGRLDLESNPEITHILSNTPCASFFEESFFGLYKDVLQIMSVMAAPRNVRATTFFRINDSIDAPLLD